MPVYITDVVRTPRGKARPDGSLAAIKPQDLVATLVDALESRVGNVRARAETLALGCVGQIGAQGGNIALVSKFRAGLPDAMPAYTVNNYCVSGLSAIGQMSAAIDSGRIEHALAGGVESMSQVPFLADKAAFYGERELPERTRFFPVAVAADLLAVKEGVSRADLDSVTAASHQRAAAAEAGGKVLLRSRIPVKKSDGSVALDRDETVRAQTTAEALAGLQPAFGEVAAQFKAVLGDAPIDHRHSIANAPPIADGAGLAFVSGDATQARARIVAYAEAGADPRDSLTAGFAAMGKVLARAGMSLGDVDRIEFMEAFAVTIAMFARDFKIDPAKVNPGGGHLAKGHPMGASGAILLSSLLDALDASGGTTGLVVASGASGVGAAMIVERVN